MAKRKNAPAFDGLLTLPVSFGNFSAGDKTCRLGCTVSRGDLKLALADKNLCEKRLALVCIAKPVEKRHYRYRPCLTLEGYEQSNPFWREMIQRKESRERDRREADRIAREIDGKHPVGNAGALIQQTVARITKTSPETQTAETELPF